MEKLKEIIVKYKWYIAVAIGLFIALYLMRNNNANNGDSGNPAPIQYTTSTGQVANQYGDPSLLLAQMQQQGQLAALNANNSFQLAQLEENNKIAMATIDANKWMAQLDANTQQNVAQLGFDSTKYSGNVNLQLQQMSNTMSMYEIDAQKFITGMQIESATQLQAQQTQVDLYKAKTEKHNANLNFAGNLIGGLVTLGSKFMGSGGTSNQTLTGAQYYNV